MGENAENLSVDLVPENVTPEDFEELLATDRFFRDCFNEYLSQPIFAESLHFNPVTFGFELKSADRDNVVSMIRGAVYYSRQKPISQQIATLHAFRPIPLLPMEYNIKEAPDIKSEFCVEMLESEKANDWIKTNRLPMFLNSDFYHYYRMGRLLVQAAAIYRASGRTTVIYDDSPKPEKLRVDRKMKTNERCAVEDTYVSYGASISTEPGQRYTQSRMSQGYSSISYSSGYNSPRLSEILSRPKSARPERSSAGSSRPESTMVYPGANSLSEITDTNGEMEDGGFKNELTSDDNRAEPSFARSVIPLPSEVICIAEKSPLGPLELPVKDIETKIAELLDGSAAPSSMSMRIEADIDVDPNESLRGIEKCKNASVAQALITVLRKAFTGGRETPEAILSRLMFNPHFERIVNSIPDLEQIRNLDIKSVIERAEMLEQEEGEVKSISEDVFDKNDDESQEKTDKEIQSISNLETLRAFEQFMKKSSGWPIFNLWLDIDRLIRKLELESLKLTPPVRHFLSAMRQRYLKAGGEFCLSDSLQNQLNLRDPDEWTIEHLKEIQPRIMQTILSYWAIRFFVHKNSRANVFLQNSVDYQLYQSESVGYNQRPVYHEPKTPSVLPLRPKSCIPRPTTAHSQPKPNRFNVSLTQVKLPTREPEMPFRRSHLVTISDPSGEIVQRAKTAPPCRPKTPDLRMSSTDVPEFFGSERMEKLLNVLRVEPLTGQYLEQFIRQTDNQKWLNALLFWLELQKYHQFFTEKLTPDLETVKSLANILYSTYIMPGARDEIGVDRALALRIAKQIDPPFEELFDEAEESVILTLYDAIETIDKMTSESLAVIGRQTLMRNVETKNVEILKLNSLGMFRRGAALPKDDDEFSESTGTQMPNDENKRALWDLVPENFRDWDLEKIVFNRLELEAFRVFLEENNVATDLSVWMDVEAYRRLPPGSDQIMHVKATDIKEKYLNRKYFFSAVSPATKKEQTDMLEKNGGWTKLMAMVPPPALLTELQTYARRRLDAKWVPLFLASPEFSERQKPLPSVSAEDDELMLKRRRAAQIAKMLEGHWSATAQEALLFRNALSNDETRKLFHRFLKLRTVPGEFLANDLLFYDEVQKYKILYHTHADDQLINSKVLQIITCYLDDSHRSPSLQIDIPHEMAEKIVWHRKEMGAYLFRDAQQTVFRILLSHWADFCRFRETIPNMPESKVRMIRIDGKLYPMKSRPPPTGIDPKHFMDALERRKIIVDRKRALKEKEAEIARREAEEQESELSAKEPGQNAAQDESYNPFGAPAPRVKNSVWRYSDYQYALERELLLNNTDRSSFMLDEKEYGKAVEFFPNLFQADTNSR